MESHSEFDNYEDLLYLLLAKKRSRNSKINRKGSLRRQKNQFWERSILSSMSNYRFFFVFCFANGESHNHFHSLTD